MCYSDMPKALPKRSQQDTSSMGGKLEEVPWILCAFRCDREGVVLIFDCKQHIILFITHIPVYTGELVGNRHCSAYAYTHHVR